MVNIRVACLCLVLLCVYGVASYDWEYSAYSTVPVLMWSDKQVFSGPKTQHIDTVKTTDVEYALNSLFSSPAEDATLSSSFNQNTAPTEVVVLFVEPELTTDQVSHIAYGKTLSQLKNAFETAASTLTLPYATVDEVTLLDEGLEGLLKLVSTKGSIFVSRMSGSQLFMELDQNTRTPRTKTVALDSLLPEMKAANVFSNGVTDLVIVCFAKDTINDLAAHDEIIGKVSQAVKLASNGNYVAVYAGNKPAPSANKAITWTFELHSETEYYHNLRFTLDANNTAVNCSLYSNCSNSTSSHTVNYFPGALIEVYLIAAILLAMLFTGGCAIFSLQTPDRWEMPKARGKDL